MGKKIFLVGMLGIMLVFGLLIAGCDAEMNGGGGGDFDSGLAATWHSTQTAANNEQSAVFEFTADGILTGDAFTAGLVSVTTSNGRISATLDLDGETFDAGSTAYELSGTKLRFSNPSTGDNIFIPLIEGQRLLGALGGDGCYYKREGNGGDKEDGKK